MCCEGSGVRKRSLIEDADATHRRTSKRSICVAGGQVWGVVFSRELSTIKGFLQYLRRCVGALDERF